MLVDLLVGKISNYLASWKLESISWKGKIVGSAKLEGSRRTIGNWQRFAD
jgi:hypothetical protein